MSTKCLIFILAMFLVSIYFIFSLNVLKSKYLEGFLTYNNCIADLGMLESNKISIPRSDLQECQYKALKAIKLGKRVK